MIKLFKNSYSWMPKILPSLLILKKRGLLKNEHRDIAIKLFRTGEYDTLEKAHNAVNFYKRATA